MTEEALSPEASRIAEFVSSLPTARKIVVMRTFDVLSKIPPLRQAELLQEVAPFIGTSSPPDEDEVKSFPEDSEEILNFVAAATSLLSFLRGEEKVDEIMAGLNRALNLTQANKDSVKGLLNLLQLQRPALDSTHDKEELANETFPSLESTSFSVDLRMSFKNDAIQMLVPVIIAHFDTDALNRQLWFQMSKTQFAKLRHDLEQVAKKIDLLENWVKQRP